MFVEISCAALIIAFGKGEPPKWLEARLTGPLRTEEISYRLLAGREVKTEISV